MTKRKSDFLCVRQQTTTDCGAACLATIAQTYQLDYRLESLRAFLPVDNLGTPLWSLVETAQRCGFAAQGIMARLATLPHLPLPCIAHLKGKHKDHFVVIHQYEGEWLLVADPAQGLVRYQIEKFAALWSGVLIVLTPQFGESGTTPVQTSVG